MDTFERIQAIDWYVACLSSRAAGSPVRGMDEAKRGYQVAMAAYAADSKRGAVDPSELSSRIAGLSESLECGDGGVRGDFRAALAEVDALVAEVNHLRGAVDPEVERLQAELAQMRERERRYEANARLNVQELQAENERLRKVCAKWNDLDLKRGAV